MITHWPPVRGTTVAPETVHTRRLCEVYDTARPVGELSSRLAAVASCGPWVIVDLTNLAYMDCGSLGILAAVRERAQLAGGDVLLAGPRGAVAWMLLLTGRAGEVSVFPSVGVAAFGAGLAAIGTRLATDGAGKSLAAATEKMVTAP